MQSDHSSILTVSDSGSDTCSVSSSCIFFFFVFFAKFLQIFPKSYANKLAIHDFIGIGRGDETSESKDLGTNSIAGSMSFVFCWWFLFWVPRQSQSKIQVDAVYSRALCHSWGTPNLGNWSILSWAARKSLDSRFFSERRYYLFILYNQQTCLLFVSSKPVHSTDIFEKRVWSRNVSWFLCSQDMEAMIMVSQDQDHKRPMWNFLSECH